MREKSIIKPKRRFKASPLEKEVDLGGKYPSARMLKTGIGDTQGRGRAVLGEFKIQEDVKNVYPIT